MEDLKQFWLIAEADPAAVARWASSVRWRALDDGDPIFDHGEGGDDVAFLVSGRVRIVVLSEGGRRMALREMNAGEMIGEMAAIDRRPRSASVFAAGPARAALIPGEAFRDLATSTPALALRVMGMLADRLRALTELHAEQTFLTAGQRLCAMLMRMSKPRAQAPGQRIVSPPPTHEMLSEMVGCRREVVSRELSALAKAGAVERSRGGLVLLRPEMLTDRVAEALSGRG